MDAYVQMYNEYWDWYINETYSGPVYVAASIAYIIVAAIFYFYDTVFNHQALRLQSHKKIPKYDAEAAFIVFINGQIVGPITAYVFLDVWCEYWGVVPVWEVPTLQQFAIWFFYSYIVEDLLSYCLHRFFHIEPFYRWIHKKHHKFTNPNAFFAIYAHPLEHIIVNLGPALLPQVLVANYYYTIFWMVSVSVNTTLTHSGYGNYAVIHDLHHERFNVNFAFGYMILDRVFGTYVPNRTIKVKKKVKNQKKA